MYKIQVTVNVQIHMDTDTIKLLFQLKRMLHKLGLVTAKYLLNVSVTKLYEEFN